MSWLRLSDNWDDDPAILNLCVTQGEKTRMLGWLVQLHLYCARHHTDGYLPEIKFRDVVRSPRWRDKLTSPPWGGVALVHQRGDDCTCLPDSWPRNGAMFYLHGYLDSNPSKEEYDVQRAKAAELRDRELQARVRARDLNHCRYCRARVVWADRRSSLGGVFDHVDPNVAAGESNLVVCCRGCNSRKGNRTPSAAGMTLLPPPPAAADHSQDQESDLQQTNWSALDPTTHVPARDGTGRDVVPPPGEAAAADGDRPGGCSVTIGPPSTIRSSHHPNPYLRSAITGPDPTDHAGLPSPADIDNALNFHDAFMPEGGP